MRVLSIIHQADAASGVFGDAVRERGHELDEWDISRSPDPPAPIELYGAVLVFGGAMHADQEERHGWLREENALLQRLHADGVPTFGVCLGGQLVAKALGAAVRRMPSPEIGWFDVKLTPEAAEDPVFGWSGRSLQGISVAQLPLRAPRRRSRARPQRPVPAGLQGRVGLGHPVPSGDNAGGPGRVAADRGPEGGRPDRHRGPPRRERGAHRGLERVRARLVRTIPRGRGRCRRYASRRDHSCHEPA